MRDDDIQTIRGTALEDGYEHLFARALLVAREGSAREPERRGAYAGHRDGGIAEKNSA